MARELKPCGTPSAYARHIARRETPCDACKAANAKRSAASRADAKRILQQQQAARVPRTPGHAADAKREAQVAEQVAAARAQAARRVAAQESDDDTIAAILDAWNGGA